MKTNTMPFLIEDSMQRVSRILSKENNLIESNGSINLDDLQLHQTAIYKATCLAITLHVNRYDIENDLMLAKQYKCIMSEFGAVINENPHVVEISFLRVNVMTALINVNDTLNEVIDIAAKLTSLLSILNKRFAQMGLSSIEMGIGIDYDSIRITRQAFAENMDNEYLWSGTTVDTSNTLSQKAKTGLLSNSLMITKQVYERLSEKYKSFFSFDNVNGCFSSSLINKQLESWSKNNL